MLSQIPAFEFWISGPAILAAATFVFATWLGLIGVKGIEGRGIYKVGLFALVFLTLAQWWQSARQEEEKAKPDRDYVFFFVSPKQSEIVDDKVMLFSYSTGVLDGVKICFSKTSDYQHSIYLLCPPPMNFDEGGNYFHPLPPDDYTIDSDTRSKLGKVREHLDIVQNNGHAVAVSASVRRKETGELLCELPAKDGVKPCLPADLIATAKPSSLNIATEAPLKVLQYLSGFWQYLKDHDASNWFVIFFSLVAWPLALYWWAHRKRQNFPNFLVTFNPFQIGIVTPIGIGASHNAVLLTYINQTRSTVYLSRARLKEVPKNFPVPQSASRDVQGWREQTLAVPSNPNVFDQYECILQTSDRAYSAIAIAHPMDNAFYSHRPTLLRRFFGPKYFVLEYSLVVGEKKVSVATVY
jgi:hypothetical protein